MKRIFSIKTISRITLTLVLMGQGIAEHVLASEDTQDHLSRLPAEIKKEVMRKLPSKDVDAMAGVNKSINDVASADEFWHQKAVEEGFGAKPDGMTWKEFVGQMKTMVQDLKTALAHYSTLAPFASFGGHAIDGTPVTEIDKMLAEKKHWVDVYEYVKKIVDKYKKQSGGASVHFPHAANGVIDLKGVKVMREHYAQVVQQNLPFLDPNSFDTAALDELVLLAAENHLNVVTVKGAETLMPIPQDDPQLPLLKAESAIRHLFQKILTSGDTYVKQHP